MIPSYRFVSILPSDVSKQAPLMMLNLPCSFIVYRTRLGVLYQTYFNVKSIEVIASGVAAVYRLGRGPHERPTENGKSMNRQALSAVNARP